MSDQRPTPIRRTTAADLDEAEDRGCLALREAALVVEEEGEEAEHAPSGRRRSRPLTVHRRQSRRSRTVHSTSSSSSGTRAGSREEDALRQPPRARHEHAEERLACGTVKCGRTSAADEPSERNGRLADAEREPALRRVEPAHDRAPARRTARCAPDARRE